MTARSTVMSNCNG